jgi:hypothetical protein
VKKAIPKTVGGKRAGAGRPATGKDPARTIRLSDEFIATVDDWAATQDDAPTRSEAIRRLVELGLKANMQMVEQLNEAQSHAAQAAKLAAELGLRAKGK